MKAMVYHDYGPPDVLKCEELEISFPKEDEVLLKVHAAAVNPLDCGLMKGQPYVMRFLFGFPKPKVSRPGRDVAGEVQTVGRSVTRFKPGDNVFGICTAGGWMSKCDGAFAEYACTLETGLATKPDNVTFEQAASAPIAALTALQGLRDKGQIKRGQKVLINGAAGGVGTFGVQIAKTFGTEVTGVCSGRNVKMVRRIGADHVIDYTQLDFTKSAKKYDLIFDLVGNHSFVEIRRVLVPNGRFVGAGVVGAPTYPHVACDRDFAFRSKPRCAIVRFALVIPFLTTMFTDPGALSENHPSVRPNDATQESSPLISELGNLSPLHRHGGHLI